MSKLKFVICIFLLLFFLPTFLSFGHSIVPIQNIGFSLKSLPYSTERLNTFSAQVFNYPCTQANFKAYLTDFPLYHLTRIPLFGFAESADQESVLAYLKKNEPAMIKMWEKNHSLLINLSKMPKWLSSSSDSSQLGFDQAWKVYNAHKPKDYYVWKSLIKDVARYLKSIRPPGKKSYYELWNEPDLDYWLDSTEDFLKLYQFTVEAIKEVDPEAKVGGPTVCSYYGRIEENRQPLISELLVYTKKNQCKMDFISFHAFTYAFYEYIRDANTYIDSLLDQYDYSYKPEIIVSEWNSPKDIRGSQSHCAAMMNGYYTFWKYSIEHHTWAAWEDFHSKTKDDYGLLSREHSDQKRGIEKPVYWGFYYMDWMVQNTKGVYLYEDKSGLKCFISKIANDEYRCIAWNFINQPDIRAVYYIMEVIPTEELIRDYKDSRTIRKYIQLGKSINGKRDKEFKEAHKLYSQDRHAQNSRLDYRFRISGSSIKEISDFYGIRSSMNKKICSIQENSIKMQIQNNEVVVFSIKLNH